MEEEEEQKDEKKKKTKEKAVLVGLSSMLTQNSCNF